MSSFSAFNDVDDTVSKPVLGSDGAARWQDFKGNNKLPTNKSSIAPAIPLKKLDRVLGTKSIRDEQAIEVKIRKDAGDREMGSGYTVFKRNTDQEEIAAKKKKQLVLDRVRPDDVPYFIQAETFEGYKYDYVFTTRDLRGTGYYWDGMDSMKKEMGLAPTHSSLADNTNGNDDTTIESSRSSIKRKKKKRKKVHDGNPIFEPDEFNPHEQVAAALLRRKQAMEAPPSTSVSIANNTRSDAEALGADSRALNIPVQQTLEPELIADGWQSTKDPASGKIYYYKRSTNERSWKKPELPSKSEGQLPEGWKATKDATSGKVYYYHTSGKTSWQRPSSLM